jgi:Secretion system C-terminal sorting domain
MKKILLLITLANLFFVNAQVSDNLFTIVSTPNPDYSTTIRLGAFSPTVGLVENIGTTTSQNNFSINGGSLNPITNRFNLITSSSMMSFDLTDGSIVSELPIDSFYSGTTFFTNVRFSNSNTTLYGLASLFQEDNSTLIGMYLAKLNTETGDLTPVSLSSIGTGYQLAGTAIDPRLMVYYYSTGSKFMGIDLYNGTVYSNPDIVFSSPNDFNFSNFAYNCADNTIYGLVAEVIEVPDPNSPFPTNTYQMRFGKINPATGEVSHISETPLAAFSYSLNAGSTIDPNSNTYYFCDGANVYGISLLTGLMVSTTPLTYEDGMYVNMMTNYNNCLGAVATRLDPSLSNNENNFNANVVLYPNPTSTILSIDSETPIDGIEVIDSNGRVVDVIKISATTLDVQNLQSGIYFIKVTSNNLVQVLKFVKI